jgi:hypothetical protein
MSRYSGLIPFVAAALVGCGVGSDSQSGQGTAPEIRVLSNRADLVSGGDALVEIAAPEGVRVNVTLNGKDVNASFARRPDGKFAGVLTGLAEGANELVATSSGGRHRLTITNHSIGGPIFSGPQVQPWICTTEGNDLGPAKDAQCNADTIYSFVYMPAAEVGKCAIGPTCASSFQDYDPESPPPDAEIARTTTDEGVTVPFIVRHERGTSNRGIHDIAVLFDPAQPFEPWAPQAGWNRKLAFTFGTGCAPTHSQGGAMDPLNPFFLGRGFMVAVSTRNNFGNGCNLNVAAEAVMMIKEHIVESYGPIRYTIGNGCSGGAENQHSLAENYPGLLDGIRPECNFADGWTPAFWDKGDCPLLIRYFDANASLWPTQAERAAVTGGYETTAICVQQDGLAVWDPTTGCGLPAEQQYHPVDNPTGARCTMQDYNVAAIGRRPDGKANKLFDYVGVQWGLLGLFEGSISTEQFVHLNENVGSFDIDWQWVPERTPADVEGLRNFYRSGQFSWGYNLSLLPSIDSRTNWTADFHSNAQREIVRARVERASGNHASQAYWFEPQTGPFGAPTPPMQEKSFLVMDAWLAAMESDLYPGSVVERMLRNKPGEAVDACYSDGERIDDATCDAAYQHNRPTRVAAGQPLTADVLKCQLKPLNREDYPGITFTDEQWGRLQATFPTGVCDWSKPGVEQQPPVGYWLTFADGPGGKPLPPAPASSPF